MATKTIHGNSQYQKPSLLRWKWESPDGGYHNDQTIVSKRFWLTDVAVVPKFYTGSDHRLFRGRFPSTRRENIDGEYERLVEHFQNCAMKAKSFKTTKRRLSLETLDLIRQRRRSRAASNQELMCQLRRLWREATKKTLKREEQKCWLKLQRRDRAFVMPVETSSIEKQQCLLSGSQMQQLQHRKGGMEKVIQDFYSDLFDTHVHLPLYHLREDGQS
ncbi:hypothetical protein RB195_024151 [Necator americanus]|uniref:Uncharacterized protein n=1 Tax=Necator americanus TaxID=51031 RepID=A0ABR1EM11_NECAM